MLNLFYLKWGLLSWVKHVGYTELLWYLREGGRKSCWQIFIHVQAGTRELRILHLPPSFLGMPQIMDPSEEPLGYQPKWSPSYLSHKSQHPLSIHLGKGNWFKRPTQQCKTHSWEHPSHKTSGQVHMYVRTYVCTSVCVCLLPSAHSMNESRRKLTALGTILAGSTEGTANRLAPNRMEGAMKE